MRNFIILSLFVALTACGAPTRDLDGVVKPIGDFQASVIVTQTRDDIAKGPLSRSATADEFKAALQPAFENRFKRFAGGHNYQLGITAAGYVLAKPGIPIVLAPKSVLIFTVIVVDEETGKVLTDKPEQITVIETITGGSLVGSGFTSSKEEQLENLAQSAARATENWLRKQDWFGSSIRVPAIVDPSPRLVEPIKVEPAL